VSGHCHRHALRYAGANEVANGGAAEVVRDSLCLDASDDRFAFLTIFLCLLVTENFVVFAAFVMNRDGQACLHTCTRPSLTEITRSAFRLCETPTG
jgi:hypothetical protein